MPPRIVGIVLSVSSEVLTLVPRRYRWNVVGAARAGNQDSTRAKIVDVAARMLQEEGPTAVTTRAVATHAGVQAPAIYRLFGDKDGLLEAVAEHVMATFVAAKAATVEEAMTDNVDPVDDLRAGWMTQIDFGVANPALFALLSDPGRALHSPAIHAGQRVLEARVHRIAATGRLRVSERRAVDLVAAAGIGAVVRTLSTPREQRDPELAHTIYETVLQAILTDAPAPAKSGPTATAVAFRATVAGLDMLSAAEQQLLGEWLDRTIDALQAHR